ncbi:tetratricopeptide repeat protein [Hyalangium gracile]|uniref:tetratricopeptide repeat protein n=1 Tax=Hyalangium gracile TaxID=394092 RepID=UPI001CC956E5|nr:tetratricopeptide repeat protein [Hyalangium gracile]
MRRILLLPLVLACIEGCSCQEKPAQPSTAPDASTAQAQPPPLPVLPETTPQPPAIPEQAMRLHAQGRKQGEAGQFAEALKSFQQAREAAPSWPIPLYDIGLTYLHLEDDARALEVYEQLDTVVPHGLSDSKRILDSLRREKAGRVPPGTLREFLEVEQLKDPEEAHRRLEALTRKAPEFVPAWEALALSAEKLDEGERLVAKALSLEPDIDTRGQLLLRRASLLKRRREPEAARKQLQALIDDPNMPPRIVAEAREMLMAPEAPPP